MQINPRVHECNIDSAFAVPATLEKLRACYRLSRCKHRTVTFTSVIYQAIGRASGNALHKDEAKPNWTNSYGALETPLLLVSCFLNGL